MFSVGLNVLCVRVVCLREREQEQDFDGFQSSNPGAKDVDGGEISPTF